MPEPICDTHDCTEPARSAVLTRLLGNLARDGIETKVIWHLEDIPSRGWSKASKTCKAHTEEILVGLARTLG